VTATLTSTDGIYRALARMGLIAAGERPPLVPLAGGVSSDVMRVDLAGRSVCLKRALPRLKVAAHWEAPIERNAAEAAWMRAAGAIVPEAVPELLGEDAAAGLFVMPFLDPATHPVWKEQLRDGVIDSSVAAAVGGRTARIHAATAGDGSVAERFANDATFHAIRLEPYLHATADAHPDLGDTLVGLARTTAANRRTLIHGDVSPKNILIGPHGPVFLDAECATHGDPAFDLAFCLNHLVLKCIWRPQHAGRYLHAFDSLAGAYLAGVTWEPAAEIGARTARLLPGLLLARIDGKSPVEYITEEADRAKVRAFARACLQRPKESVMEVSRAWRTVVMK
jgi:aminoglycoside phosphotransferase (APT) family kinase protein